MFTDIPGSSESPLLRLISEAQKKMCQVKSVDDYKKLKYQHEKAKRELMNPK